MGFHLRDAAAGQEQAGTSQHRWVRWSTPRFSSFPFYWSFEGWSNGEFFRTSPSLSFFLPCLSLGDGTRWGGNQLPVSMVWADKGTAGFVTMLIIIAVKNLWYWCRWGGISSSPRIRRDDYPLRDFTTLRRWLMTGFKPVSRYERPFAASPQRQPVSDRLIRRLRTLLRRGRNFSSCVNYTQCGRSGWLQLVRWYLPVQTGRDGPWQPARTEPRLPGRLVPGKTIPVLEDHLQIRNV